MLIMNNKRILPQILMILTYENHVLKGKLSGKSFSKHWKLSYLHEIIHLDLCGPMRTKRHRGMEYFITFIDDYSQFGHM